jgi:3',5'-nucleoside bisphosphate phosphatase
VITCFADLHVHTALSPCAADEMTPPAIVARALERGVGMIAVCDHNSARNAAAVQAAAGARLAVLAGMEITSAEECHIVGLFPDSHAAEAAGASVTDTLPEAEEGYAQFFGDQPVLDARGQVLARETHALAMATQLDIAACVALVHRHGGLAVAAHVDRRSFGVIGQLGVFPADVGFDAIELSRHLPGGPAGAAGLRAHGLPIMRSSDSHFLEDVGAARTQVSLEEPSFAELALALRGERGRTVADA